METIKLSKLKLNQSNPRFIKDAKFKKLVENLRKYPNILHVRPIVIESWQNPVILGGNMRYRGLMTIGYEEIPAEWVRAADELTDEEKRAFIILDNNEFGEWDMDALANEWDLEELEAWGTELPKIKEPKDLSDETATEFKIEIECVSEVDQETKYNELIKSGYKCRILTL